MKLTYPICCGVDVHKTFLVATVITSSYESPKYKQKRFSNHFNQLLLFRQWLIDNNCRDICMESTGKYWIPVWNVLEDSFHVVIANPKWVSAIATHLLTSMLPFARLQKLLRHRDELVKIDGTETGFLLRFAVVSIVVLLDGGKDFLRCILVGVKVDAVHDIVCHLSTPLRRVRTG